MIKHYWSATPKAWRKAGDAALLVLLAWQPMIMNSPYSDKFNWWANLGVSTLLVLFKFWTNTKKVESI